MIAKGEMGGGMGEINGNKYFLKSEKKKIESNLTLYSMVFIIIFLMHRSCSPFKKKGDSNEGSWHKVVPCLMRLQESVVVLSQVK